MEKSKSSITPSKDGPYLVKNIKVFKNSKRKDIPIKEFMSLCRCGKSSSKPFCDGTHLSVGFKGEKKEDRAEDKWDTYVGERMTIKDNRGVCAHRGHCTDLAPKVFNDKNWGNPDNDSDKKHVAKVIRMCPSGALRYELDGKEWVEDEDKEPAILISKDGPLDVKGSPKFEDPDGYKPANNEHYCLCRCGGSKNKPFCDGTHWHIKFKDEDN